MKFTTKIVPTSNIKAFVQYFLLSDSERHMGFPGLDLRVVLKRVSSSSSSSSLLLSSLELTDAQSP